MAPRKRGNRSTNRRSAPEQAPSSRSRTGRPSTLTQEVQDTIVQYVVAGNFVETACYMAGVSSDTVKSWLRVGGREARQRAKNPANANPDHEAFYLFSLAIKKASAEAVARNVANISLAARGQPARIITRERELPDGTIERTVEETKAVPGQWTAAAWWLERTNFRKFGRKSEHKYTRTSEEAPPPPPIDPDRPLVVRSRDE